MYNQGAVFFDVDDTLIKGQSQKLFINYLWKNGFVSSLFYVRLMVWFILYRLHIVKDPSMIAKHAFGFLKNMPREKLSELVDLFFDQVLIHRFYKNAILIIKEHQKNKRPIFLVSNAFDTLVERVSLHVNADGSIATKLKESDGILTGDIDGIINYGKAKVERVNEFCVKNNISLENSWGYADHPSDIEFLKLVKNPVVVNADKDFQKRVKGLNFSFIQFYK
ncbi:MAG: Hydrolase [Parcubacteria group bacterium GW2011_GWC1_42_11]|uniref:Hydrolase n=1 Tax=Candidatus Nomurabacteria bacterium GW2011_GWC2_42_20 TaxID=1618756 RepID=A0A0G1CB85_9BACT|nr:MAG: Hydrolase [Parcubacteria group bacterium GW2011_GWC1_42_11]KKS46908.1 MAG: Hydrolase [Candidatus Nomurabacteria bacterium GW2011_GWC2_42_20]HBH71290.1 hypothetical protein [Candidatus Yonathbacteria bacterium]